jgi:hypothetical protein
MIRQAIIDGISALSLGTFAVSSELPWDAAGQTLYFKNFKVFYVDEPEREQSTLFNTLDGNPGGSLATLTTTVSVYVVVDAKQQPANYDSLMSAVEGVKNTSAITAVRSREVDRITTFEADALVTEFVFRFTELKIS